MSDIEEKVAEVATTADEAPETALDELSNNKGDE